MQDFTGVPAVVDLAAMRDAMADIGGEVSAINPLVDVDLVIDHSVQVDAFGNGMAFEINAEKGVRAEPRALRVSRRGQGSFNNFRVVPPATGIPSGQPRIHRPSSSEPRDDGVLQAYPDTLSAPDSHTTMVNGLGVLGWGSAGSSRGGDARPACSMLLPQVIGFKLRRQAAGPPRPPPTWS